MLVDGARDDALDFRNLSNIERIEVIKGPAWVLTMVAARRAATTGLPIQKMEFGRMAKPWISFNLETGELVISERIDVGKSAPGRFVAPVDVWVRLKPKE